MFDSSSFTLGVICGISASLLLVSLIHSFILDVRKNNLKQSEHGANRDKDTCDKEVDMKEDSSCILISGIIKIRKEKQV